MRRIASIGLIGLCPASALTRALGGQMDAKAVLSIRLFTAAFRGDIGKVSAISVEHGLFAGEGLPSVDRHIDIGRIEFDGVTGMPVISAALIVVPEPENGS